MAYKSSPRPTYDRPTHIPASGVTHHLWGDTTAGRVPDWCYVSTQKIHQLVLGLAPGRAFRHSPDYRTRFASDEVYYVLQGQMALANPETGEVQVAGPGESFFFRRDTWHHGFNIGTEALLVLELLAPPPSTGSTGDYALEQPDLDRRIYERDDLLGRIGLERPPQHASMRVIRDADLVWRLEGGEQQLPVGIIASTEHLTAAKARVLPGVETDPRAYGGDVALYHLGGPLHVRVVDDEGDVSYLLEPGDGFYAPEGATFFFYNVGDTAAEFILASAPGYLPG